MPRRFHRDKVTFSAVASWSPAGRGCSASIKLGSMLGSPAGCQGLPLTVSPRRALRADTPHLAFDCDFDPRLRAHAPPPASPPPVPLLSPHLRLRPRFYSEGQRAASIFSATRRESLTKTTLAFILPLYFASLTPSSCWSWPLRSRRTHDFAKNRLTANRTSSFVFGRS